MKRILLSVFMTCNLCNMVYGTQQYDVVIPERENILSSLNRNETLTGDALYNKYQTIIETIEGRFIRTNGVTINAPVTGYDCIASNIHTPNLDYVTERIEYARIAQQKRSLIDSNNCISNAIKHMFYGIIYVTNDITTKINDTQRLLSPRSIDAYQTFVFTIFGYCQNQTLEHLSANEKERLVSCFFSALNSLLDIIYIEDSLFVANEEFDHVLAPYLADAYNGLRAWHTNVTRATRGTIDELNNHLQDNVPNRMMTRIGDAHDGEENPSLRRVIDQINNQHEDDIIDEQSINSAYLSLAYVNVGDQLSPIFDITNKLKSIQYDRLCLLRAAIKLAKNPLHKQQIGDELKNAMRTKFDFYDAEIDYMDSRNFFNLFQKMSNKVRMLRTEIGSEAYSFNNANTISEAEFKNTMLDTYGKIIQYNVVKDLINQSHANHVQDISAKLTGRIQTFVNSNLAINNRTVASYLLCNYIVNDLFENVREQFFVDNMI